MVNFDPYFGEDLDHLKESKIRGLTRTAAQFGDSLDRLLEHDKMKSLLAYAVYN